MYLLLSAIFSPALFLLCWFSYSFVFFHPSLFTFCYFVFVQRFVIIFRQQALLINISALKILDVFIQLIILILFLIIYDLFMVCGNKFVRTFCKSDPDSNRSSFGSFSSDSITFWILCSSLLCHSPNCNSATRLEKETPTFLKEVDALFKRWGYHSRFWKEERHIWTSTIHKIMPSCFGQSSLSQCTFWIGHHQRFGCCVLSSQGRYMPFLLIFHSLLVISLISICQFCGVDPGIIVCKHSARYEQPLQIVFFHIGFVSADFTWFVLH